MAEVQGLSPCISTRRIRQDNLSYFYCECYTSYMSTKQSVVVEHMTVVKNKKDILRDISFSMEKGSIVGLIGPSGAGKTTLMRGLVGIQRYAGKAYVLGNESGAPILRGKVGYVSQNPAVYEDLSVEQNLEYFSSLLKIKRSRIEAILKQVELCEQRQQVVSSLSGGQRSRVSLAIALLGNPDLLIMDEPTVGLDPVLRNKLWNKFRSLAQSGKTLLISSHVMDEAARCDCLVLMREGNLLWQGNVKELLRETKTSTVEDAFIVLAEGRA